MTTLIKLTFASLAALALSTSFASAAGGNGNNLDMPIVNIPIIDVPQGNGGPDGNNGNNGNGNFGPGIIDMDPPRYDPPAQPHLPGTPILNIPGPKGGPSVDTGNNGSPQLHGLPDVGCKVQAPEGTTDDIWIINTGDVTLPMGSRIRYRVPSTGDHGAFELPRDIAVGQKFRVRNLLNDALSGAPCTVRLIA